MIFIDACFKKPTPYTPIWMMRQAGRYLPEYMEVRKQAGDFLSLCKDYKKASEVSLQPIDILDVDAAIIFSDILVVPLEMGMNLRFEKGEGPVFDNPISTLEDLEKLDDQNAHKKLNYVYDALKLTREKLSQNKALIGFCGSPWTIATYMIEGSGSKNYAKCKKMLYQNPELLHKILNKLTQVLKLYLEEQIKAGANALTPDKRAAYQKAQLAVTSVLGNLLAITENYPDLKANQNFLELQAQLEGTENRINVARTNFNNAAKDFNTAIRRFPRNILASLFGFEKRAYFEASEGAETAPQVQF